MVGVRGTINHRFREYVWSMGAKPLIRDGVHEAAVACADRIISNRNVVERPWAKVKAWRAAATQYGMTTRNVLSSAATIDGFKRRQVLSALKK